MMCDHSQYGLHSFIHSFETFLLQLRTGNPALYPSSVPSKSIDHLQSQLLLLPVLLLLLLAASTGNLGRHKVAAVAECGEQGKQKDNNERSAKFAGQARDGAAVAPLNLRAAVAKD